LADRRTKLIQNKINVIRNKMTKQLLDVTKSGDAEVCRSSWGDAALMDAYCNDNVINDFAKNMECKIKDNFCFVCCDTEFGKVNKSGKDVCFNKCLEKENIKGEWTKNTPAP